MAVRYAIQVFGRFGLNYCAQNMDNFLVGWKFSAHWLGFYKKAYDLFVLVANELDRTPDHSGGRRPQPVEA